MADTEIHAHLPRQTSRGLAAWLRGVWSPDASSRSLLRGLSGLSSRGHTLLRWPPGNDRRLTVQGQDHFCTPHPPTLRTPPPCFHRSRALPWAEKALVESTWGSLGSPCPTLHLTLFCHWCPPIKCHGPDSISAGFPDNTIYKTPWQ